MTRIYITIIAISCLVIIGVAFLGGRFKEDSYHQGFKDASCDDGWHETFEYHINGKTKVEPCK